MSKPKLHMTDLLSVRTLEKILDNFSQATGLGCIIRDLSGKPITKPMNPTKLWYEVVKHPHIEEQYHKNLLKTIEKCVKTGQIEIYNRYIDTMAFTVPIYIEGRMTAFFVGGLARYGNPNMETCTAEAKKLNIDLDSFLEMYLMIPIVTLEKLEACGNLLRIIGSTISSLAKEGTEAKAKLLELEESQEFLEKKMINNSQKLKESETRYKNLFNTINDGVYVTDENGVVKEINKRGAEMLGYNAPEELIGTNFRNIYVNPKDRDEFVKNLYLQGHIEHFHPYVRLKNGTKSYFETNSAVIKDEKGRISGVHGIFRAIGPHHHSNHKDKIIANESSPATIRNIKNDKKTPKTFRRIRR